MQFFIDRLLKRRPSLDVLGLRAGTDKSRLRHDHLRQYEKIFGLLRDESFTFLEIGIHFGASLKVWEEFFTKATIIGVDIEPSTKRFETDRVKVEIGSQGDAVFLHRLATTYRPTVVIDDGSHERDHQIRSFETLWPSVKAGGFYIVEDLSRAVSDIQSDYFTKLCFNKINGDLETDIANIKLLNSTICFEKKMKDLLDTDLDAVVSEVKKSSQADAFLYLAEYLERHKSDHPVILETLERGAQIDPFNPWLPLRRSYILEASGDRAGALEAAKIAADLAKHQATPNEFQSRLAHLTR